MTEKDQDKNFLEKMFEECEIDVKFVDCTPWSQDSDYENYRANCKAEAMHFKRDYFKTKQEEN